MQESLLGSAKKVSLGKADPRAGISRMYLMSDAVHIVERPGRHPIGPNRRSFCHIVAGVYSP